METRESTSCWNWTKSCSKWGSWTMARARGKVDDEEDIVVVKKEVEKEPKQRKKLFRTKWNFEGKYCNLIIDGGSSKNLVSTKVVNKLNLKCTLTQKHIKCHGWKLGKMWLWENSAWLLSVLGAIVIAFYLTFFPWTHVTFYWEGLGSMIKGYAW